MEHAADALKIGAWILIFVTALSITINAFSQARESVDSIVTNIDREYITTYVEESDSTKRTVGVESIIPAIYRSVYFNFKIIFSDKDDKGKYKYVLYQIIDSNGTHVDVNYIDLEKGATISNDTKELFLSYILYGDNDDTRTYVADRLGINYVKNDTNNVINVLHKEVTKNNEFPKTKEDALFYKIKNKTFEEDIGVYYQEEVDTGNTSPNANKTEKRVITYKAK